MPESDPLENLLPSLIQCFGVIFIGYLSVRLDLITSQSSAIGTYVTKFALPALFFRSMATINFSDVNWLFILAIAISKLILFSTTFLCTIIITRPINFGKAGIFSMFITQSNDVALGYPILLSLYPSLAKYIYLFAPSQLIIINPMCFILLELHEYRSTAIISNSTYITPSRRILLVLKNVILNPLVFMTVIGVMFNFILSHQLPIIMDKILEILADSFAGVALFYLGMNMVGKISIVTKKEVYLLGFLLLGKLILLPFLTREAVVHLINIHTPSNQTLNYSLVAFLYGGLPTAPPVFLIANSYQILPDLIATGLVVGTFISGPLMFVTARVITMVVASKTQFDGVLKSTAVSISIISVISCIWVLLVFLLSRKCKIAIHKVTICYTFFVILSCSGVIVSRIFMPHSTNQTDQTQGLNHYFQFSLFFIGCVGTRLWTIFIAASLMIIKRKGISNLIQNLKFFYITGTIFPVAITISLVVFSKKQTIVDIDSSFQYGRAQLITSLIILAGCISSIIIFLILEARSPSATNPHSQDSSQRFLDSEHTSINTEVGCLLSRDQSDLGYRCLAIATSVYTLSTNDKDTEELQGFQRNTYSSTSVNDFNTNDNDTDELPELNQDTNLTNEELQIQRHLVLVLVIVVTMSFGFFLCLWRLINEELSGVYILLEFLDCVFNFGQGFILWMIFGLDTELIVIPFKRRIMTIFCNQGEFYIPPESNLSADVLRIRNQFITNLLEQCRHDISKDIRYMFKLHKNVFTGKQFIDWVIKNGLSNGRLNARGYGQVLLISRVIEHVKKNRNLRDDEDSLYRFVDSINNYNIHRQQ